MNNICTIYHYFEKDYVYRENLIHFLIFGYRKDIDFYFVVAEKCTIEFPELENLHVIYVKNHNFDYGGYSYAINNVIPIEKYEYFFFINSTVRGPFLPSYVNSWTEPYIKLLNNDVGIVGSTINIVNPESEISKIYQSIYNDNLPLSSIQSMIFLINKNILKQLIQDNFFNRTETFDKIGVVVHFEIHLSRKILSYGKNLRCLISRYNEIDYRKPHSDICPTSANGDIFFPNRFFGRTLHPFETIFTKTNRNLFEENFLLELSNNCFFLLNEHIILSKSIQQYIKKICQEI